MLKDKDASSKVATKDEQFFIRYILYEDVYTFSFNERFVDFLEMSL